MLSSRYKGVVVKPIVSYQAVYGCEPRVEISSEIPSDLLGQLHDEEDILHEEPNHELIEEAQQRNLPCSICGMEIQLLNSTEKEPVCEHCDRERKIASIQADCHEKQKHAASKMMASSSRLHETIEIGANVVMYDGQGYILASELRILEAHCLSYINGSMFYFYGGLILDYVDFILVTVNSEDIMTDVSELFMLIDLFLQAFDGITEPVLLERSYHLPFSWFGKKLLDVLDSYSCMEHFVAIEPLPDGSHIKWTGKYTAVPVHSLLPPPFLVNTTSGEKKDMDALLRFVRNHVRWNNILDVIKTSPEFPKRFEKRIHLEENGPDRSREIRKQRIISEKSFLGDAVNSDIRRLEINIGLFSHEIFAPSRYKELIELLSNLRRPSDEDVSKSEDITASTEPMPPQKQDYELDLTMEIIYKEGGLPRATTIQVCHIDNACYIAASTAPFVG